MDQGEIRDSFQIALTLPAPGHRPEEHTPEGRFVKPAHVSGKCPLNGPFEQARSPQPLRDQEP